MSLDHLLDSGVVRVWAWAVAFGCKGSSTIVEAATASIVFKLA